MSAHMGLEKDMRHRPELTLQMSDRFRERSTNSLWITAPTAPSELCGTPDANGVEQRPVYRNQCATSTDGARAGRHASAVGQCSVVGSVVVLVCSCSWLRVDRDTICMCRGAVLLSPVFSG